MRRTSAQPAGGVMTAELGRIAIEATIASLVVVPGGTLIVRVITAGGGRSARGAHEA